jgi:hypothetical protein
VKIDLPEGRLQLDKELNELDRLVIDFVSILDRFSVKYVLVLGYLAILFGRSRSSEDIDLIVERMSYDQFIVLWAEIEKDFHCLIPHNPRNAYDDYLTQRISTRFARRGQFLPNIEVMFPKATELDTWALQNGRQVILNGRKLWISPLELQIPYKLFLGSTKDIEDARHLYRLFRENLDEDLFREFLIKLDKHDMFNRYLA